MAGSRMVGAPGLALLLAGIACARVGFTDGDGTLTSGADSLGDTDGDADEGADGGADEGADGGADADGDADGDDSPPWPTGGVWTTTSASPLSARLWVNSAWTGQHFAVWGGATNLAYDGAADGALYEPVTNAWTSMASSGAPSARHTPSHTWAAGELVVYGGAQQFSTVAGGGRYDPALASWSAFSSAGSPGSRVYHVASWTGEALYIWGGWGSPHLRTGMRYDPLTDAWSAMALTGAPSARSFAASAWTGSELVVWGGCDGAMGACTGIKGDGARYRPASDSWAPIATAGAPAARTAHSAVWTGSRVLVFGGCTGATDTVPVSGNASYDPTSDTWTPLSTAGAPANRCFHAAGWLPGLGRMIVWGGAAATLFADGALYDPVGDAWTPLSQSGAPMGRQRFAFATSDRCLFIWGGADAAGAVQASGAVWCGAPSR